MSPNTEIHWLVPYPWSPLSLSPRGRLIWWVCLWEQWPAKQANVVVVTSIVSIKSEKEFSQGEKVMLEASSALAGWAVHHFYLHIKLRRYLISWQASLLVEKWKNFEVCVTLTVTKKANLKHEIIMEQYWVTSDSHDLVFDFWESLENKRQYLFIKTPILAHSLLKIMDFSLKLEDSFPSQAWRTLYSRSNY